MLITTIPFNETTKREYQGSNIETLLLAAIDNDFDLNRGWAGFHQWKDAGRIVRKGQHGTRIVKWMKVKETKNGEERERLMPKGMFVFHFNQTDELTTTQEVK